MSPASMMVTFTVKPKRTLKMIYVEELEQMVIICARLYHDGIIFESGLAPNGMWRIELTGF